jgi:hypothetical protein
LWLKNDREETSDLNALLHGFVAVPVAIEGSQEDSGFRRFDYWQVGEDVEFEVIVVNNGDDRGGFDIDVPAGFAYAGQLLRAPTGADVDLAPGVLPTSIDAHRSLALVFRGKLTKQGAVTFATRVTGVGTVDPVAANDRGVASITVNSRAISSSAVTYSKGELTGNSAEAHRAGDRATAARRTSPKLDIAVVRVRRNRSEWLRNGSGKLKVGTKALPCGAPVWLKTSAHGSRWAYRLKAVPPRGTYLVLIRPRGANTAEFGYRLGNLFRVRLP